MAIEFLIDGRMDLLGVFERNPNRGFSGWIARTVVYLALAAPAHGEPIKPIPADNRFDAAKAALGRMLFHETRLSKDNSVSCASCHELSSGRR